MHVLTGVLLLVPLISSAEPVRLFDPPKPDDSPTAFACTAETLASAQACTFEGKAGSASGAQNVERAKGLAESTCAGATAASGDKAVREVCLARLQSAAAGCNTEGAIVDGGGRFTEAGRRCYRALAEARGQAESVAHAAPGCCACLATHHCSGAGESCVANAAKNTLAATCGGDACMAECGELFASAPAPATRTTTASRARSAK